MGDGKIIPITHIGSTKLLASNNSFKLHNTSYAPAIKQNIVSVSKFCQDNLTSIEFFSSNFLCEGSKNTDSVGIRSA